MSEEERELFTCYTAHTQSLSLLITLSRSLCSLANKSNTCHVVNVARHVRSLSNNNSPWRSHMAFCCCSYCCYSCYCLNFEFILFFSVYQLAHSITNCIKRTAPSPWYNATDCPNFSHCSSVRQSRSIRSVGESERASNSKRAKRAAQNLLSNGVNCQSWSQQRLS